MQVLCDLCGKEITLREYSTDYLYGVELKLWVGRCSDCRTYLELEREKFMSKEKKEG